MQPYLVRDVIAKLPNRVRAAKLPRPPYIPPETQRDCIFYGVETFQRHMTDEGWQLQIGFQHAGGKLAGRGLELADVDLARSLTVRRPTVAVLQDKREWDPSREGCFDKLVKFHNVNAGKKHLDVFRMTIHKDAHHDPFYDRAFHNEWGPHGWIVYYHPEIVTAICPWMRPEDIVRTYHTIDGTKVPRYDKTVERTGRCLLSGCVRGKAYPLRARIHGWVKEGRVHPVDILEHPGYHANGSHTSDYLQTLSRYKVSICTASRYGYALRKIIESTACGCVVITDLPADDVLPEIDGNLVRVHPNISYRELTNLIRTLVLDYDPDVQEKFALAAIRRYDYRYEGSRLAMAVHDLRLRYPVTPVHPPREPRLPRQPQPSTNVVRVPSVMKRSSR